jgi:alpha-tubulin suppressor-like RCC1 family protein
MTKHRYANLLVAALLALGCNSSDTTGPQEQDPTGVRPDLLTGTLLSFQQISAGQYHTCGITTAGKLYCWGSNSYGQLGNGTTTLNSSRPVAVAGTLQYRWITVGRLHTCAIAIDYRAYCWGINGSGMLGDGTQGNQRSTPTPVAGGLLFRQVGAGEYHTCGLTTTNKVYCWGADNDGDQFWGFLGNGGGYESEPQLVPKPIASNGTFRQLSVGWFRTCVVNTNYKAFCWGNGWYGTFGNGIGIDARSTPVAVSGGLLWRQVSVGGWHVCGTTTSNQAYCWGSGKNGELGNGKNYQRNTPRLLVGGLSFGRVTSGQWHTCGETTGSKAYCWGANANAQLGDGSTTSHLSPVLVSGGLLFNQLTAGFTHSCGVGTTGKGYCWGTDYEGEIGAGSPMDGTSRVFPSPVRVEGAL